MGSADIHIDDGDDDLHVARDRKGNWWAVAREEGSYGGSGLRYKAVRIAMDASAAHSHGNRRIVVHRKDGSVECIITRVRVKATPQFFQDSVP